MSPVEQDHIVVGVEIVGNRQGSAADQGQGQTRKPVAHVEFLAHVPSLLADVCPPAIKAAGIEAGMNGGLNTPLAMDRRVGYKGQAKSFGRGRLAR